MACPLSHVSLTCQSDMSGTYPSLRNYRKFHFSSSDILYIQALADNNMDVLSRNALATSNKKDIIIPHCTELGFNKK